MQFVIMADIEKLLIDFLEVQLPLFGATGVAVGTKLERLPSVAGKRPAESVVLFRTGGGTGTMVSDRPTVTVEVRAVRESRAEWLAQRVRALINAAGREGVILDGHQVYSVAEFSGPASLPDPITESPRYSSSYQVHIAGTVVNA